MTQGATQMQSRYVEHVPPPALADRVVCLWTETVSNGPGGFSHGVLPDGCVDLIWVDDAPPKVAGPATRRTIVHLPAGSRLVGVRLSPGWAAATLGHAADAIRDAEVLLADLWPRPAATAAGQAMDRPTLPARLGEVAALLTARFATAPAPDPLVHAAVRWLVGQPAGRVRDLARHAAISERQLERRFRQAVGYGPKAFQRIMRLQRLLAVAAATGGQPHGLAALAHAVGYADQAHMCRDVRALADQSPRALLGGGSTLAMSDLFNTDVPVDASFGAIDQTAWEPSWNNA